MTWLAVAVAGAAGAVCRYTLDFAITARTSGQMPWGTWAVNVSGSFLAGVLAGLVAHQGLSDHVRVVAAGGFAGAYTTFSTLMYETLRLFEDGERVRALCNVGSIAVGVVAAALGWAVTI